MKTKVLIDRIELKEFHGLKISQIREEVFPYKVTDELQVVDNYIEVWREESV